MKVTQPLSTLLNHPRVAKKVYHHPGVTVKFTNHLAVAKKVYHHKNAHDHIVWADKLCDLRA